MQPMGQLCFIMNSAPDAADGAFRKGCVLPTVKRSALCALAEPYRGRGDLIRWTIRKNILGRQMAAVRPPHWKKAEGEREHGRLRQKV